MNRKHTLIFLLSKENLELSRAEVKSIAIELLAGKHIKDDLNTSIYEFENLDAAVLFKNLNRLAYTKKTFLLIHSSGRDNFLKSLKEARFDYPSIIQLKPIGKSFKIFIEELRGEPLKFEVSIDDLAGIVISRGIEKINLNNPDMSFYCLLAEQSYFGLRIWENKGRFEERKANKRPAPHPTSMNPKLARALVNLGSAQKEVLDPFCGSGGILIEAGIIGLKVTGLDIDESMIRRANMNLNYFKVSNKKLLVKNAYDWTEQVECVVTDVPYGRSSKLGTELGSLIDSFLLKYKEITNKMVLVAPEQHNISEKARANGWTVNQEFKIFVHGTLTRSIVVLTN